MEPFADAAAADAHARVARDVIDFEHLARMTFGEEKLEAEVLALFDRQAAVLLAHMRDSSPQTAAAFAHTLKGSAKGVGAWRVAAAAEEVEKQAITPCAAEAGVTEAVNRLADAVEEAHHVIASQLPPSVAPI